MFVSARWTDGRASGGGGEPAAGGGGGGGRVRRAGPSAQPELRAPGALGARAASALDGASATLAIPARA